MDSSFATNSATIWGDVNDFSGPLKGVRVVDLSKVLAGPLCTQMLADQGANIIKIEPPFGDESRALAPPYYEGKDAAYFSALNRGKRSITLDFRDKEDRKALLILLENADVLIENYIPGTMEKWGLGYNESLKERFPKLIYCSISGFGDDGPLGKLPGYDAVLQAMCGLMSINGTPESGPTKIGIPIVDHLTAYTAFSGILLALLHRNTTGISQKVDATLFDTAISLLVPHAANWIYSGIVPQPLGSSHPNIAPYDSFKTKTNPVFLGILNNSQFHKLCECIKREDLLANQNYITNKDRVAHKADLTAEIQSSFLAYTSDELCDKLLKLNIPIAPIHTVDQILNHPHTQHRKMRISKDGYQGLGSPIKLSENHVTPIRKPPKFGEHNNTIKKQLQEIVRNRNIQSNT